MNLIGKMSNNQKKRGPYGTKELTRKRKLENEIAGSSHDSILTKLKEKLQQQSKSELGQCEDTKVEGAESDLSDKDLTEYKDYEKTRQAISNQKEGDFEALWTNYTLTEESLENYQVDTETFQIEGQNDDYLDENEEESVHSDDVPLYKDAHINIGSFMLLLSLFLTRHNLSGDASEQLLEIFNFVLPTANIVPTGLYMYRQYFKNLKNPLKYHFFCPKCGNILKEKSSQCQFTFCGHQFDSRSKLPYFLEISVIEQLKIFFLKNGFFNSLQTRFKRNTSIRDIYDGSIYKRMFDQNGPLSKGENLSFFLNTDGAPIFKSSNVSVWPLFLVINELDIKQRYLPENMILAGLWFGSTKPVMSSFLKFFVFSMQTLSSGVEMFSPEHGTFICQAFLIATTADLPARALLCNCVQYNGNYSCWSCEQKGETATRGKGHVHVFPFVTELPKGPLRTPQSILQDAQKVIDSGKSNFSIHGIKGPSWLSFCPKFELVDGMAIDYMHGILLGVQKLLLKLWFSSEFASERFSFSKSIKTVDDRLVSICPTLDMSRTPRSIQNDLKYWKASEFENFLLFYGMPVLHGILDPDRYFHFSNLVNAIFILLSEKIGETDIDRAQFMLFEFCKNFSNLYDVKFMTLNIHHLLHLPDQVRNLGPLYTHSCFPFENKNGLILKMIKGTQNIDQQIVNGVSFIQKVPELKQRFVTTGSDLENICERIEKPHTLKRGRELFKNAYILGATSLKTLKKEELDCVTSYLGNVPNSDTFVSFNRIEFKGRVLYSKNYSRMLKRDNSIIQYCYKKSVKIAQVSFFLLLGNEPVALVDCFTEIGSDFPVEHIVPVEESGLKTIIPMTSIRCLCLIANLGDNGIYICKFPNTLNIS